MSSPVEVLLVDDSRVDLEMLRRLLEHSGDVEVVAALRDAREALSRLEEIDPDVIVTDLVMPGLGGQELVDEVMRRGPRPILVVTAKYDDESVFRLLEAGALEVMPKPSPRNSEARIEAAEELARKVRVLSKVPVFTRRRERDTVGPSPSPSPDEADGGIVVVGASTGGPPALQRVFESLPSSFPWPILCVQHVGEEFTEGFVSWLDGTVDLDVRQADSGSKPEPGTVTVPQVDKHLLVTSNGRLKSTDDPAVGGHRPSITSTMRSAAKAYGSDAIGVLLTGMGDDGAAGLESIHDAGGTTLVQDEETSVVFGMPARAIDLDAVDEVLALDEIGPRLVELARRRSP